MRQYLPLISGAFASMNLQMTANSGTTMDLSWTCDAEPDFTVTYQQVRPDNFADKSAEFDQQTADVDGATTLQLTGLTGPREYLVEVCSDTVNSTCGCSSGRFRTAGRAVYINSIEHYNSTGGRGGKSLQGAFFFDDSFASCVSAAELAFGNGCDVAVNVYAAGNDPAVRAYAGSDSSRAVIGVSSMYRGNFVTFEATFESTLDACWDGAIDEVNSWPLSPGAITVEDAADPVFTETESAIAMNIVLVTDIFDEFGNNVTDDGVDQGYPMQNQTNFMMAGVLANATTDLNENNVACPWDVVVTIDNASCPNVEDVAGNLGFTDNDDGTFSASSDAHNQVIFFQGKIPAPDTIKADDPCDEDALNGATVSVTLKSWN